MADLGKVVVTDGGNYSASVTYEKLTFVHYQGDAYMTLKTVKGVTPTDDGTNYKLFCKSAELATATKAGIVLPDGTTTTVDGNGKISVKKATTSAAGIVKPAATDFIMAADGTQKINTQFTQATELANIIAGEAIAQVWGKVSKAIATTMNLDQNTLLKNMISNIAVNDPNKLNSAAYIYTLVERIGMGTELAVGANLTDGLNKVNSDFADVANKVDATLLPKTDYVTNTAVFGSNWINLYQMSNLKLFIAFGTVKAVIPHHTIITLATVNGKYGGAGGGLCAETNDNFVKCHSWLVVRGSDILVQGYFDTDVPVGANMYFGGFWIN